jgi:hypothetical protein
MINNTNNNNNNDNNNTNQSLNPILNIKPYLYSRLNPRLYYGMTEEELAVLIPEKIYELLRNGGISRKAEILEAVELCFGIEQDEVQHFYNMALQKLKK